MLADVFIIVGEEIAGPHASPHLPVVLALNLPWLLLPILLTIRLWNEHPFSREAEEPEIISVAPNPSLSA
jgi:hypothetical protein